MYNVGLPGPKPANAGPIVRRSMGLPIPAGCDRGWIRPRASVVTPPALRCSALDRWATRETFSWIWFFNPLCFPDFNPRDSVIFCAPKDGVESTLKWGRQKCKTAAALKFHFCFRLLSG